MQEALDDAGQKLSAVEYINVHYTCSTPLGDIAKLMQYENYLCACAKLHISATKSMTGHLMGAAGIVEAIASVLTIQENTIPPTINHSTIDPAMDTSLNYTFNSAQHRKVDVVLSNNFWFRRT